jgi:ElaB/YqjD/DUF883 family membrane-anchored ribosome-binding protein
MARSIDSITNELNEAKAELKDKWQSVEEDIRSQFSLTRLVQKNPIEAVTVAVVSGFMVARKGNARTLEILKTLLVSTVTRALRNQ